jgi:BirA family biotin operon repressor/biotin-[acetyl-CoA-carboxylase] ligase
MYSDLDRPPLRPESLAKALAPDGWRVEVLEEAASTNAVVAERARAGEAPGLVVVAEHQSAGRGRQDRTWESPLRAGLTFSVLVARQEPVTWMPLLAGLAVARALREQTGLDAVLKWPNDVLIGDRKVCGLLAEASGEAVVLGIGLNVTTTQEELPRPDATSLAIEGATTTDRDPVLRALLRTLKEVLAEPSPEGYRALCTTLGREVSLELPGGLTAAGTAEAVDDAGRLVVAGVAYAAGDVTHVR